MTCKIAGGLSCETQLHCAPAETRSSIAAAILSSTGGEKGCSRRRNLARAIPIVQLFLFKEERILIACCGERDN